MKTLRVLLLCVLFGAVPTTTWAQSLIGTEAPSEPIVTVPRPAALTADWWSYFETAKPDELQARASGFQEVLDEIAASLSGADKTANAARATMVEIHGLLDALVDVRDKPPSPVASQAAPVQVEPSPVPLAELLQLAVRRQEARLAAELKSDDEREQDAAVKSARQRVDDAMATYLTLAADAPQRLRDGLLIVQGRLLWAMGVEELAAIRSQAALLLAEVKSLDQSIEFARDNPPADQDVAFWETQLREAEELGGQLAAQAATGRLRLAALGGDLRGQSQRRRQQQLLLELEAKVLIQSLRASEARVARHLLATGELSDEAEAEFRNDRTVLEGLARQATDRLPAWRTATNRERAAANELMGGEQRVPISLLRLRVEQADSTTKTLGVLRRQQARADLLTDIATRRLISGGGQWDEWMAGAALTGRGLWEDFLSIGSASLFTINDTPVTTLGLLRLTFILLVAWAVSHLVGKAFRRLMGGRETMSRASIYTLSRLFHYAILVIGVLVALTSIGIDFTKFALIASAFGVGLGFGLQAIFSNFMAGLIILFERSLKVGDYVELESGVGGEVQEVSIRSTLITTNDNVDILVPNSEFVNGRVTNWTLRDAMRRARVPFGVAYGTDKDLVRKAALEAAGQVPHTLSTPGREPQVWLVGFGDSSLDFELVVWLNPDAVKRPATVHAAYCWAIESALGKYGIEIPFPQRDLNLRSVFGYKDEEGWKATQELHQLGTPADGPPR